MQAPDRHALAESIVRYVGDGVALVVARSGDIARDAAELIEVDYEELEACTDVRESRERCFDWDKGDAHAVEAAFAGAARIPAGPRTAGPESSYSTILQLPSG